MEFRFRGLMAATYTPMHDDGTLNLDQVPPMVEHLQRSGVSGIYICGSTGEGMSLSSAERRAVAEAYVSAAAGRMTTVVQVGHNSLVEARSLAAHAGQIGADVVSATAPSYFKVDSVATLADSMAEVAAGAPKLPFYYYHIPSLTGASLDMVEFLRVGAERITNLAGLKYTTPMVHEYQACLEWESRRLDILWGCDEMLLSALVVGARGAIGSTYNVAAPLYRSIVENYENGDLAEARRLQFRSVQMIRTIYRYPFHAAMKQILTLLGIDCGCCRLPQRRLTPPQIAELKVDLERIGFFEW